MQPADQLNYKLLDRYFVMLNECGIEPIVVISKVDLLSSEEVELLKNDLTKNEFIKTDKHDRHKNARVNKQGWASTACNIY
jgi:putative ribosome biogenesis GTPase RsgA